MRGLDNWITGHYGEDQPFERESESADDERLLTLASAMEYLQERALADADEQITGEFEAWEILDNAKRKIEREYECHFCGRPTARRKDKYCSQNCYKADHEGL